MAWWRCTKGVVVALACVGWLLPVRPGFGAEAPSAARVLDVRLTPEGVLTGWLLDTQQRPLTHQPVALQQGVKTLAVVRTDERGRFRIERVSGGVYSLAAPTGVTPVRVWTAQAAPPAAANQLVIVDPSQQVVRGQQPLSALFTNPLIIGLVIAAAVAIPIAVHEANDDDGPAS